MKDSALSDSHQPDGDRLPLAGPRAYLLAMLCVAVAFGVRAALDSLWGDRLPYALFFVAVFVVIQVADTGPSIAAIIVGFLLGDWFFVPPRHSLLISERINLVNAVVYFLISFVMLHFSRQARRAERHFRSLVEHSSDVVSVVDEEGIIRYQGPSVRRVLGYSPQEMVGHNGFEFVHPEDRAAVRKVMALISQPGGSGARVVFRHRHKDGTWRVVETSGRLQSPQKRLGKRRFVVNLRDITERRRLEEAHAQLAAIVESCDDAIIGKSLEGTILSWNGGAERLYGYTAKEAVGSTIGILVPFDQCDELVPLLERVGRGERINHFETIRRVKDGRLVEVSLSISPVRSTTGQIVAASTIARDITERKNAERERERLVKELQAALAEVKTLSGLLPICAHCKKIRDDRGYWNQIELYIRERSNANFTHSVCPDCSKKFYPELFGNK